MISVMTYPSVQSDAQSSEEYSQTVPTMLHTHVNSSLMYMIVTFQYPTLSNLLGFSFTPKEIPIINRVNTATSMQYPKVTQSQRRIGTSQSPVVPRRMLSMVAPKMRGVQMPPIISPRLVGSFRLKFLHSLSIKYRAYQELSYGFYDLYA
jgi:hypothetical protein